MRKIHKTARDFVVKKKAGIYFSKLSSRIIFDFFLYFDKKVNLEMVDERSGKGRRNLSDINKEVVFCRIEVGVGG